MHSCLKVVKGFNKWISIKILPLDYWSQQTFEAIASYYDGLVSIANETLNIVNVTEAKIQVQKNLCGFMSSNIEILDEK